MATRRAESSAIEDRSGDKNNLLQYNILKSGRILSGEMAVEYFPGLFAITLRRRL